MLSIYRNPSCLDIEKLNNRILQEYEDETLILSLARHTNVNFFCQTWVAQLVMHLAQRNGQLVIRDAHNNWEPCPDRFTTEIDGVAALVYSHIAPYQVRLENVKRESAPADLYDTLVTKLKMTSKLESAGQSRTFIAIDPEHSIPIEFSTSPNLPRNFQHLIQNILKQFGDKLEMKSLDRRQAETALHNFIYEVFQNTHEHGRYNEGGGLIPGLRYLRIRTYIDTNVNKLRQRACDFPELEEYISRSKGRGRRLRFMELSVSDGGQGIVSHYANSMSISTKNCEERKSLLYQLVGEKKSSKDKISGAGLGLPNAMNALFKLEAFISLRTEEFWMYRDFGNPSQSEQANILHPVSKANQISRMNGTQFNVMIDFSN